MSDQPECLKCGAKNRVPFPMMPKTPGFRFGQICVPCDEKENVPA